MILSKANRLNWTKLSLLNLMTFSFRFDLEYYEWSQQYDKVNWKIKNTTGIIPKSNLKYVEKGKIDTPNIENMTLTFLTSHKHFNKKKGRLNYFYGPQHPFFVKWCDHVSAFPCEVNVNPHIEPGDLYRRLSSCTLYIIYVIIVTQKLS